MPSFLLAKSSTLSPLAAPDMMDIGPRPRFAKVDV
jgi:hypothetical protein